MLASNVIICGSLLLLSVLMSFLLFKVHYHTSNQETHTPQCAAYQHPIKREDIYVLFTSRPLHWQGEGQEFPKCWKNSCSVRPEPRPEDIPVILESCIRIPNILLHGHYLILYTLVCQSNSRLTPVPESDPSARILRQHFILEDSHLTEWVWVPRLRRGKWTCEWQGQDQEVNEHESGRVRQEKLYALSYLRRISLSNSSVAVTGGTVQSLVTLFLLTKPRHTIDSSG